MIIAAVKKRPSYTVPPGSGTSGGGCSFGLYRMQTAGGLNLHLNPSKNRRKYNTTKTLRVSKGKAATKKNKRNTK
jgi:hypothetical protein